MLLCLLQFLGGSCRLRRRCVRGVGAEFEHPRILLASLCAPLRRFAPLAPPLPAFQSARFSLHVAEDDGTVDVDFPGACGLAPSPPPSPHLSSLSQTLTELAPGISITQVGVAQFVLCQGGPSAPVLLLNIPSSSVVLHACETQQDTSTLAVTCAPAGGSPVLPAVPQGAAAGKRATFVVHLQHTPPPGSTQPSSGVAAAP